MPTTNSYLERILDRARHSGKVLVLPEADPRMSAAAAKLRQSGITVAEVNPELAQRPECQERVAVQKFAKDWTIAQVEAFLKVPLHTAALMVALGEADCMVAGATNTTGDVIRAAIRLVGVKPEAKWVSSSFLMIAPDGSHALSYADCAVIPDPTPEQLATIGAEAANTHQQLTGEIPKVAFLSFSTKGSARHPLVDKVTEAVQIFGESHSALLHEGELQFDAAIIPEIAERKLENSVLGGQANVLVFPDLNAGNIAYKITERLGGYFAWGPLLQGLQRPIHDLSRGCRSEDIFLVSAIALAQASEQN